MCKRAELIINKDKVIQNFELFLADKPNKLKFTVVAKNKALGLGIPLMAKLAAKFNATYIALACLEEVLVLKDTSFPLLVLGERAEFELEDLAKPNINIQIQSLDIAKKFAKICAKKGFSAKIHFKVDTGLGRYGVRWNKAKKTLADLLKIDNLKLAGVMTHFAMSDETDKSYAKLQWQRFKEFLRDAKQLLPNGCLIHTCNSGGYLDLPDYHADMCRIGVLFTGNYPSAVCRRIKVGQKTLQSPFTLKSRIGFIKTLKKGDLVGYGMHYKATEDKKIAVLPLGYGDGYPRMRNKGKAIINSQMVDIIGSIAMDSMMIDLKNLKKTEVGDEVVLMGAKDNMNICPYDIAQKAGTVVYDILSGWQNRLIKTYI